MSNLSLGHVVELVVGASPENGATEGEQLLQFCYIYNFEILMDACQVSYDVNNRVCSRKILQQLLTAALQGASITHNYSALVVCLQRVAKQLFLPEIVVRSTELLPIFRSRKSSCFVKYILDIDHASSTRY